MRGQGDPLPAGPDAAGRWWIVRTADVGAPIAATVEQLSSAGSIRSGLQRPGSIMGIGFPPWTGGVRQFIAGYPGGRAKFVARAQALATAFGPRLEPTGPV